MHNCSATSPIEAPNILPIPPPTEFPFLSQDANTSSSSSSSATHEQGHTESIVKSQTDPQTHRRTPRTPSLKRIASQPRPDALRPMHSERPVPTGRRSYFGLTRARSTFTSTAPTDPLAEGSVGIESSEDDELHLLGPHTQLSGQPRKLKSLRIAKTNPKLRKQNKDEQYRGFAVANEGYQTKGKVSKRDGRLNITVNETANRGYLANALGTTLKHHLLRKEDKPGETLPDSEERLKRSDSHARVSTFQSQISTAVSGKVPTLNIVIMVIGSRGDIQPFLKIGKLLKEGYGHRIRIATHPAFKKFVEQDSGLEFFSVGGDPAELMAFMVKNPGLIPSASTVRAGEIGRRRDAMFDMFQGFWRACINATDDEYNVANREMMAEQNPFIADAIIANPPSFAHVHCAERLGIPLHLMFTFPYSPTQQFPHPLANVKNSNVDSNYTNFMTYPLVEMMYVYPRTPTCATPYTDFIQDMAWSRRPCQPLPSQDIGVGARFYALGTGAALSS